MIPCQVSINFHNAKSIWILLTYFKPILFVRYGKAILDYEFKEIIQSSQKEFEISMWTFPRKSFCTQNYCVLSILCVLRKGPSFFSAASYNAYELVRVEIAEYRSLKVVMNFFVRKPAFTSFLSLLCDFAFYFNYTICNFVLFMHSCSTTKNAASTKV